MRAGKEDLFCEPLLLLELRVTGNTCQTCFSAASPQGCNTSHSLNHSQSVSAKLQIGKTLQTLGHRHSI